MLKCWVGATLLLLWGEVRPQGSLTEMVRNVSVCTLHLVEESAVRYSSYNSYTHNDYWGRLILGCRIHSGGGGGGSINPRIPSLYPRINSPPPHTHTHHCIEDIVTVVYLYHDIVH